MAEICGVLLVTLLLSLFWIPSDDAEENEGGTFSLASLTSWKKEHKIELMNYVVQLNESVNIRSPIDPVPKGLHWFSLNMENELPASTRRKPGLSYSHYFDKFLKTYNKSWARAFTFSKRNRFLNITQVNLGYADVFRLHVDDYEKDNEMKNEDFDVAITLMTYSSHECGFKGMPHNAKLGALFILSCRVTVNGLWNASLVFRNSFDGSEIRGEVYKCGHQPNVGSRICSTVRVNANANILAYTCNLEFPVDLRGDPKNAMFQKSKWTTRFNREVVCFLPKVYLETIPADVSFLCNNMPCEETVEVSDSIRCLGYGYPQPDFDLRIIIDNSTEKELLRQMFAHVEKIHVYAENSGTIKSVLKGAPGSDADRSTNDDESDERRAQLMEEVTALTQQFMEEYGPNMDEEKLKELYDSIIENYTFPNLEYKGQVFKDSDDGGEEGDDSASSHVTVDTVETFSNGDEPSFTRLTDGGIGEQEMTIERNSDDTTEEEEGASIPDGTREAFSNGDEPSFTRFTDGGIGEQEMTIERNSDDTTEEEEGASIPDFTREAFSNGDEPSFTRFTDGGIGEQEMTIERNSDDGRGETTEEEEGASIPDGTREAVSDGDEPSLTQLTDENIWEQQMTTEWNSDDRGGDDTAIPDGTSEAVSDEDEPTFTKITDENIWEQKMTTEWNSGAPDSGAVSEPDEDDEMSTQAPDSVEKQLNGFKDYQVQQTDVGHIEVSCNVSNALGWGYIVMSLQVLPSTKDKLPDTVDPIQPDTTMSAVTVDEKTDEPDKETDEPDEEPGEYTRGYTEEGELSMMPTTEMEHDEQMTSARYPVWENDETQGRFEPTEDARRGTGSDRVDEDLETTQEDARRGTGMKDSFNVDGELKATRKGAATLVEAGEAAGEIGQQEKPKDTEAEEAAGIIARQEGITGNEPEPVMTTTVGSDSKPGGSGPTTAKAGRYVQSVVLELFLLICGVCLTRIEL